MALSDKLALLEILVTIFIGYYITHLTNIKDAGTRCLKDYFIEILKKIRNDFDQYIDKIITSDISAKEFVKWYNTFQCDIDNFDKSIRQAFPIDKADLSDSIDNLYSYITGSDDFNNQYQNDIVEFPFEIKSKIKTDKSGIDLLMNDYVIEINGSNCIGIWKKLKGIILQERDSCSGKDKLQTYYKCLKKIIHSRKVYIKQLMTYLFVSVSLCLAICWLLKPNENINTTDNKIIIDKTLLFNIENQQKKSLEITSSLINLLNRDTCIHRIYFKKNYIIHKHYNESILTKKDISRIENTMNRDSATTRDSSSFIYGKN